MKYEIQNKIEYLDTKFDSMKDYSLVLKIYSGNGTFFRI